MVVSLCICRGRFFKKKNKKIEAKNDKKLSSRLDPSVSLPSGVGNVIRPSTHPLTTTIESEGVCGQVIT